MINESVRGKDVFVVQPTCGPAVNDNVMELLIMCDAFKRASARHITAVVPFYGYARQDRRPGPGTHHCQTDGGPDDRIRDYPSGDRGSPRCPDPGFFDIPVDHMPGGPILADYVKEKGFAPEDMVVISPDLGGVSRARNIANRLECGLAIIDKRRPEPGVAEVMNLIGNVEGKICIMVDDIVDTAGSLCEGAKALKKFGAKDIYAA